MYKQDLSLNNLQWLICHKTKLSLSALKFSNSKFPFISLSMSRHTRSGSRNVDNYKYFIENRKYASTKPR